MMNILIVEDNIDNHESAHFLCLVNKGGVECFGYCKRSKRAPARAMQRLDD